jgi:two-component system, response regulator PdtaR
MANPQKAQNAPVVLVVEDEMMQRMLTVSAFDVAGFVVMEAENATRAIAILGSCGQDIQFLFTDIEMAGGINGIALAAHTRERWPSIDIAVTSGKLAPSATALPEHARFFSKPYNTDLVIDHVRQAMLAAS